MTASSNGTHSVDSASKPDLAAPSSAVVRVAAVGDLHCTEKGRGAFQPLFQKIAESADVLVLCGDLTDFGLPAEAEVLAGELTALGRLPVLAVLGNHDYESDQADAVRKVLDKAGVILLDGDAHEVCGIGFAGGKGFAGGFGRGTLGSFGERSVKAFVQEAQAEAMKLESSLARLRTPHRIAVLHYSPIKATVEGEPPEIFAFLGCSRLEEPLNRYQVTAVVHGHAHNGAPEGKTSAGVPVYNVALPLMRKRFPGTPPFRILDVPVNPAAAEAGSPHTAAGTAVSVPAIPAGDPSLAKAPVHAKLG
jgi:Icc-related predicted phosphoesterase